jgi:acetoin utilization deacetylase AcuC-like enzyme
MTAPVRGTPGYVYDPLYLQHEWPGHPESARRLRAVMERLTAEGVLARLVHIPARPATEEQIARVHSRSYLASLRRIAEHGGGHLDLDTYVAPASWEAACLAAGGLIALVEAALDGQVENGLALVRPPGHHARPNQGMGFCLLNNVAIAARAAVEEKGVERVLIVDFDVHHGNGTQEIFEEEAAVCYISTHLYPFYPGTGHWRERGRGPGEGTVVNIPLPPWVGDQGYGRILAEVLVPRAERFRPELILASAGYDGHWRDPLAMMGLSVAGFARIACVLKELADELCPGHLAFTLEGGYDDEVLAQALLTTCALLLGDDPPCDPLGPSPYPEPDIDGLLDHIKTLHGVG